MKDFVVYTLLRLGLFLATWAVITGVWALLAGSVNYLLTLVVAAIVSAVASVYLLSGPRARLAARVESRASNMTRRLDEARAKEDQD